MILSVNLNTKLSVKSDVIREGADKSRFFSREPKEPNPKSSVEPVRKALLPIPD